MINDIRVDIVKIGKIVWLKFFVPPICVFALYWPVLEMPFFWDDVANFIFMENRSILSFWQTAAGFPYYRPLGFTVFRIWQWLFGVHNTYSMHLLNIVMMIVNGWLVMGVSSRLYLLLNIGSVVSNRENRHSFYYQVFAMVSGIIFCFFPFASLVIPLVASMFHLLVTMMALASLFSVLNFFINNNIKWLFIAVVLSILAPFAHESGVVVGFVLFFVCVSVLCVLKQKRDVDLISKKYLWISMFVNIVASTCFPVLWSYIDKMRTDNGIPMFRSIIEIGHNIIFFLNALTFPVQPLALIISKQIHWSEANVALCVGFISIIMLAFLYKKTNQLILFFVLLVIYGLLSMPSIVTLPQLYVVVSPRLTLLPSICACMVWSGALVILIANYKYRVIVLIGVVFLLCSIPIKYIHSRVDLHERALNSVKEMVNMTDNFVDDSHLIVNPTTWLALAQHTYPIVHDGVVVIPEYHDPAQLVYIHNGNHIDVRGVNFPLVATEPVYHYYDVWGEIMYWEAMADTIRVYDHVWLTEYGDSNLEIKEVGQVISEDDIMIEQVPLASFDDGRIMLFSVDAIMKNKNVLAIELVWRMNEFSDEDVFVHIFDCRGGLLGMADGPPLGRMFPFWQWKLGEQVRDVRSVEIADGDDPCVSVEVGLFDAASGNRVVVSNLEGAVFVDNIVKKKFDFLNFYD
ncbi:MAG TPA: hypothetical protein DCL76_02335 [Chloroflexi bacterium]|nr:hypothetical protein [Chloroflexota bacterium]